MPPVAAPLPPARRALSVLVPALALTLAGVHRPAVPPPAAETPREAAPGPRPRHAIPPRPSPPVPVVTVERHAWGSDTVEVRRVDDHDAQVTIRDHNGPVIELGDFSATIGFRDVTGDGIAELQVVLDGGGSCCSGVEHWYQRTDRVRRLFAIDRGRGEGLTEVRDLDHRGRPELIFALTHWLGDAFACTSSPGCRLDRVVVLGWDGHRYRDRTRAFPAAARALARSYLASVDDEPLASLAGYYGNAVTVGDGPAAARRIARLRRDRPDLVTGQLDLGQIAAAFGTDPLQ